MTEYLTSKKAIQRDVNQRNFMDLCSHIMQSIHPAKPYLYLLTIYN